LRYGRVLLNLGFSYVCEIDKKFRHGQARNLRQMMKLPIWATFTEDRIPKDAIFAASKAIESIHLVDFDVGFDMREEGIIEFADLVTSLSKLFPNVRHFSSSNFGVEKLNDLLSVSSWMGLQTFRCPNSEAAFRPPPSRDFDDEEDDSEEKFTLAAAHRFWEVLATITSLTDLEIPYLHSLVSKLPNLKSLNVKNCSTGFSFSWFSSLCDLEQLRLESARSVYSSWVVPSSDLTSLKHLTNLRELTLPGIEIVGSDELREAFRDLSKLEKLDFSTCKPITSLPEDLFAASSHILHTVLLEKCDALTDIEALVSLPLLKTLKLKRLRCSDAVVSSLSRMIQLETLQIASFREGFGRLKQVADGLAPFGTLRRLILKPGLDRGIDDDSLACVSVLTSLQRLHVASGSVTAAGFERLRSLENLREISMYCPKLRKDQVKAIFPNAKVVH
jgi:hypothetical protein